ncbi:L,D-transpeptidase family protein [Sphingomonas montana]|uniref:L,D-transpeptidase family protein n=1 Tax=Sphingomonas montana TaxID=1843236 RepID=UPI00096C0483|nr:L,D-transpeptidase family protein [Sphingomonas montana]
MIRVDTAAGTVQIGERTIGCTIGRGGACDAADKREGDGRTPRGSWPVRAVLLRPDRVAVPEGLTLPWRWIAPADGWSDDVRDPAYNRPVTHPHRFSAERLWREDGLYDVIVVLGHNDAPPVPGLGSAIFLHCRDGDRATEGCVAVARDTLLALLPQVRVGTLAEVR